MSLMSRIIVRSERLSRAPASAGAAAGPPAPTTVAASTARRGVANRVMTGWAARPWASAASQRASERGGCASGGPSRSRVRRPSRWTAPAAVRREAAHTSEIPRHDASPSESLPARGRESSSRPPSRDRALEQRPRIVARVPPVPRRDWTPPSRRRVLALRDRLRLLYGRPSAPPHRRPLDELILTVLSQSTSDRNRDVAFLRLRARYPSWSAVRDAPLDEVEAAIRPGGISKVKSQRIQAILRALDDPPSLDHLAGMDVAAARAELCR